MLKLKKLKVTGYPKLSLLRNKPTNFLQNLYIRAAFNPRNGFKRKSPEGAQGEKRKNRS